MDFALCEEIIKTCVPSLLKKLISITLIAGGTKKSSRERGGDEPPLSPPRIPRPGWMANGSL